MEGSRRRLVERPVGACKEGLGSRTMGAAWGAYR